MNQVLKSKIKVKSKGSMMAAILFVGVGFGLGAEAYPGFSERPKSGSSLEAASNEAVQHVISELSEVRSFQLIVPDPESKVPVKVNVIFLGASGALEADPEIPSHMISVRNEEDQGIEVFNFAMQPMFYYSVKKVGPNRLHFEGNGGSTYGCSEARNFDVVLTASIKDGSTVYHLKYAKVVNVRTGELCKQYE